MINVCVPGEPGNEAKVTCEQFGLVARLSWPRSQAPTLRNTDIEVVQAWVAWYFLSCEHHQR